MSGQVVMPAVGAGALLVILLVTLLTGAKNRALMSRIEHQYFPALDASRLLQTDLSVAQRGLQDASSAGSMDQLTDADELAERLLRDAEATHTNPVVNQREMAHFEDAFRTYYSLARDVSVRLIREETGEPLLVSLKEMSRQYNDLNRTLEASAQQTRNNWAVAAEAARADSTRSSLAVGAVATACLLALFGLSLVRERDFRRRVDVAVAEVDVLSGLLPICAWCRKIRDGQGEWSPIEVYVSGHSAAEFTHGICPDCAARERLKSRAQGSLGSAPQPRS